MDDNSEDEFEENFGELDDEIVPVLLALPKSDTKRQKGRVRHALSVRNQFVKLILS